MTSKFLKLLVLVLLTVISCKDASENKAQKTNTIESAEEQKTSFYVGTYTKRVSEGIYKYSISAEGKLAREGLMAKTENPSFLAFNKDKSVLLAINGNAEGTVESYQVHKDSLHLINQSKSGGAGPCFVALNDKGQVLVAHYGSGTLGLLQVQQDGSLSDLLDVQQHEGDGPTDRQKGPHAHSAWFVPNSEDIIAVDLGTDELWFSHVEDKKLVPNKNRKLAMKPGAGPRHLSFHPNGKWIYVLNELNGTVTQVIKNGEAYVVNESISILPEGFKGKNKSADIHVSRDGKFVYASNRGPENLAILEVDAANGSLKLLGHEPTRGETPRNFQGTPDDKFVLVANKDSDNIISYKRDATTGMLEYVDEIEAPEPVCILFE